MTMDLFPTILEAAGIKNDTKIDGLSILEEVVKQNQKPFAERNQIYTWLQGYKKHALRKGEWKLVKDDEKSSYELYHLKEDPYETKDLATVNTKKFKELLTIMTNHLKEADKVNWRRPSQVK